MNSKLSRVLIAGCGIVGTVALTIYYSVPFPLPPANATVAQLSEFATKYHDAILLDAWLQGMGSLLTVVFVLGLLHMAGVGNSFMGRLTIMAGIVILCLSLIDGAFVIGAVESGQNGHFQTALTCFDLTYVFVHVYLIAPSLYLLMGLALLGTHLLPKVFSYLAVADGITFQILGLAGLFSAFAVNLVILLLVAQEFWVLAAAITLLARSNKNSVTAVLEAPQTQRSQFSDPALAPKN